jgi:pyruvate kinase
MFKKMLLAGMDIMRLNFSHGNYVDKRNAIKNLRAALEEFRGVEIDFTDGSLENYCAIAADTKGPEIRTGGFKGNKTVVNLVAGTELRLVSDPAMMNEGTSTQLFIDYPNLVNEVKEGVIIYIDDGLVALTVSKCLPTEGVILTRVENDGQLGKQKGVNVPGVQISLPALTSQDEEDLAFAVEENVDMVFASFIRRADDVRKVRAALGPNGQHIKIISKIENIEGVENFDEILKETDGIMVARGDLGIEIPPEKVFLAQKSMISRCNIAGKPVICATQMLESMVSNPRPTRAECGDVANAVLDGVDCVMLSGETAKGKFPVEAVRMMSRICREAEAAVNSREYSRQLRKSRVGDEENSSKRPEQLTDAISIQGKLIDSISISAVLAAFELNAAMIIVLSRSGSVCHRISKYRPPCPILLVTDVGHVARSSYLYRGVHPALVDADTMALGRSDPDMCIAKVIQLAYKQGMCKLGDDIVVVLSGGGAQSSAPVLKFSSVAKPLLDRTVAKGLYAPAATRM